MPLCKCSEGREVFELHTLPVCVGFSKPPCVPSSCLGLLRPQPWPLDPQEKTPLKTKQFLLTGTRWQYYPNQDKASAMPITPANYRQTQRRLLASVQVTIHLISQSFQTILSLHFFLLPQKILLLLRCPSVQKQTCPKLHPDGSREGEDVRAERCISPTAIATISITSWHSSPPGTWGSLPSSVFILLSLLPLPCPWVTII